VDIVTKAKPRDLPVIRSCIKATSVTVPAWAKSSWRSISSVWKERLPTYNLVDMGGCWLVGDKLRSGDIPLVGIFNRPGLAVT
jgi:hypothetical protein